MKDIVLTKGLRGTVWHVRMDEGQHFILITHVLYVITLEIKNHTRLSKIFKTYTVKNYTVIEFDN